MSTVGIVSALLAEARHLAPLRATPAPEAVTRLPGGGLLVVSGMGLPAAARAARVLADAGAGALLSFGLAGGLDPALPAGTVCLPEAVISREGACVPTSPSWREQLQAALLHCRTAGGPLLSSPVTVGSLEDKAGAFRSTRAAVVDMESLAVGEVARERGLPFMAVRVVVDTARDTLPPAITRAAGPDGQVPLGRLLGALGRHPGELPAVIRLGGRFRAASRSLAAAARSGALIPPQSPQAAA